jgi:hypothetical protein
MRSAGLPGAEDSVGADNGLSDGAVSYTNGTNR